MPNQEFNSGLPSNKTMHSQLCYAHPSEIRRTLLNYAYPYWNAPHPTELRCYATSYWATPNPTEIRHTTPHPTKLRGYATFYWSTPHSSELRRTVMTYAAPLPTELRRTLLIYPVSYRATPHLRSYTAPAPKTWFKDVFINFQRSDTHSGHKL